MFFDDIEVRLIDNMEEMFVVVFDWRITQLSAELKTISSTLLREVEDKEERDRVTD